VQETFFIKKNKYGFSASKHTKTQGNLYYLVSIVLNRRILIVY